MGSPARFLSGLTTSSKESPLGEYPYPDPFHAGRTTANDVVKFEQDFLNFVSATNGSASTEWNVSGTSSTMAVANGAGGVALITPGGAATATAAVKNGTFITLTSGMYTWFLARFQASAVAGNVSFKAGLQYGTATTDGLWFSKAAAETAVKLVSAVNNTATTLVASGIATAVAATNLDLGFFYNGVDLLVYSNDILVARVAAPTIGATNTFTLTNKQLTPFFQITPTATDTLTVDYVLAATESSR